MDQRQREARYLTLSSILLSSPQKILVVNFSVREEGALIVGVRARANVAVDFLGSR